MYTKNKEESTKLEVEEKEKRLSKPQRMSVVMEEEKVRVCVTGGTGFLGSWIIKRLLEDGYTVNTTVRSNPGIPFESKKKL